jgi:hypothetical protein
MTMQNFLEQMLPNSAADILVAVPTATTAYATKSIKWRITGLIACTIGTFIAFPNLWFQWHGRHPKAAVLASLDTVLIVYYMVSIIKAIVGIRYSAAKNQKEAQIYP